jgi:histidinol-phosphate aminotransferase
MRDLVARAVGATRIERYPDARMGELRARIAARTGAAADDLLIGAGSDEVISIVLTALGGRSKSSGPSVVLLPNPTFVMYRATARVHGHKPVEVPLDAGWDLDARGMARACEMMPPTAVFIASPNNPTGNRMSDERIEAVLAAAPEALVVVDEAYADYAGGSLRGWRARHPNLAVLRTLSKVGLAALRVGWLEGDSALVRELDKARQPYNVSATSQAAAAAVLADGWSEVERQVRLVVSERERVSTALRAMPGVDVPRSDANFVWIGTPRPAAQVHEALLARGVLVRSFHRAGGRLQNRLRVTIGAPADNDRFLEAFGAALST